MKHVIVTFRLLQRAEPYLDVLRTIGVRPCPVSPEGARGSLSGFAGLLLTGGTDVNPGLYGEQANPHTDRPDDERDALEQRLLHEALATGAPILAICRGMQLFNVAHPGGTLIQHLEGHAIAAGDPGDPAHPVAAAPGTLLERILGPGQQPVNSRHHQAVAKVGAGLVVSALAPDGTIEGIERPDRRFAVAVQWHPEDQADRFAEQKRLFEAFRDAL